MSTEELWTRYSPKLKSYILKQVSDKYEAEDILQEIAIRIQKNAGSMKDIANVEAWLYRIAHNLIVDYFRRVSKYSLLEDINEKIVQISPKQENYNKETAECLLKLVAYLPVVDQEAILESDYIGRKQSMLGQKWGLSNSGSKSRIQRARKKLKGVLHSCCEVKSDNAGNIIELHNKENTRTKFLCLKC